MKLSAHHASQFVKLLYIGDSGTGKTGSLTSLVAAGYHLKILDLDNGLDTLAGFVRRECPDKIDNVDSETIRDKYRTSPGGVVVSGQPKAFTKSLELMTKWPDGTTPADWGPQTVFVLDSLTALSKAAFEWAEGLNPNAKEPRTWYFVAQKSIENTIALLTSEAFHCNVIVISHIDWRETPEGLTKGYANSIGKALGPTLPRYFNSLILAEKSGSGANVARTIKTLPTSQIDLKTPVPFKLDKPLPLGTGLATVFEKLKET